MISLTSFNITIDVESVKKLNKNKKLVKKLAKKQQAFLASESVIKQIPPLYNQTHFWIYVCVLSGKFPTLVSHQESLEAKVNETKTTVKFLLWKFKVTLAHPLLDHWDKEELPIEMSQEAVDLKFQRFMIYVHAKGMIVDDEYVIVRSANINQRSLAGSKDTEIDMASYQPHHTWAANKRHPHGQMKWNFHYVLPEAVTEGSITIVGPI
ncbi:phospholipase D delta [Tanacetum coccineum]|uniref:phospholipase D n=1 Tax=Tanacetum coccineum TaxID=301880 RepID=A0ABQ5ASU5_9ASTR